MLTELEMRADTEARHAHRELVEELTSRCAALEAKLALAVKGLDLITDIEPDPDNMGRFHDVANATLTELRGSTDG